MVNQHPWQKQRETSVETMNNESDEKKMKRILIIFWKHLGTKSVFSCVEIEWVWINWRIQWMNKVNYKRGKVPTVRRYVSDNSDVSRSLKKNQW